MLKAKVEANIFKCLVYFSISVTIMFLVGIIGYVLFKGIPHLSWDLFQFEYNSTNSSLFPALVNTLVMTVITLLFAVPLGIGASIYLVEYANRRNIFVKIVRSTTEILQGIPSIIYGLFGYLFFVNTIFKSYSIIAGALTLAIMILPAVMRTTEEALNSVEAGYKESSFALGAGKLRTIFKIVLPSAIPGIFAGIILSIGRIVGETAALIYTSGAVAQIPEDVFGSGRTLSVHMYALWSEGLKSNESYATAVVLLIGVLILNALSDYIQSKIIRK